VKKYRNAYKILYRKSLGKHSIRKPKRKLIDNIQLSFPDIRTELFQTVSLLMVPKV
jgi:hypothetical protein